MRVLGKLAGQSESEASSEPRAGSRRRWHPTLLTAVIALAAQACGLVTDDHPGAANPSGPSNSGGAANAGGGAGDGSGGTLTIGLGGSLNIAATGGSLSIGATGGAANTGSAGCADSNLLADQAVAKIGSQRRFYSWTTDEQVAELRAGGPLFSRSESPGKGRGLAFTQLAAYAAAGSQPEQMLAAQLGSTLFAKARFSWTNPWATLLGWPGETYGTQLLQIELRPEAWIAVFGARGLFVYDAQNQPVAIATALATPERIGAIYFLSNSDAATSYCGSFSQGAVGFREFVLGNIQMVQRWSLATPEIAQRLATDIAALQAFSAELACLQVPAQADWSSAITCNWGDPYYEPSGALQNYDFALGIPSELYWPSAQGIATLVAALQMSMPTGAPLIVNPGG